MKVYGGLLPPCLDAVTVYVQEFGSGPNER